MRLPRVYFGFVAFFVDLEKVDVWDLRQIISVSKLQLRHL